MHQKSMEFNTQGHTLTEIRYNVAVWPDSEHTCAHMQKIARGRWEVVVGT